MRQFHITKSAIREGLKRLIRYADAGRPDQDVSDDQVAAELDSACVAARDAGNMHEILDVWDAEEQHYLVKLVFDEQKIIGLVGTDAGRERSMTGYTLISLCSYSEAGKCFQTGRWKSVDGKPVLPAPERRTVPATVPSASTVTVTAIGQRGERRSFVLALMRAKPGVTNAEIDAAVRAKFGRGMTQHLMAELRREERAAVTAAPAAATAAPAPRPLPPRITWTAPTPAAAASLATMTLEDAVAAQAAAFKALAAARASAIAATERVRDLVAVT